MTHAIAMPALVTAVETVIVYVRRLLPMVTSVANTA